MTFKGCFPLFSKIRQIFSGSSGKIKLDETCIFKLALKCNSFDVVIGIKIPFLEFRLLLSRFAPYYSSLPRTVWKKSDQRSINLKLNLKLNRFQTKSWLFWESVFTEDSIIFFITILKWSYPLQNSRSCVPVIHTLAEKF